MPASGSDRSLGERLDLTTVAEEWDSDPVIRERIRTHGRFLHADTTPGEDIKVCCLNKELLIPLLTRMAMSEKRILPGIHDLANAIRTLLTLNKRPPKPEDHEAIMAFAWRVRFMLGFVKAKTRRGEVSQVS